MSEPLVLGIETSCDETGVGIVRGHTLLADAVASSVEEHARFGGVVPEVASRAHLEAMVPTIERACETAGIRLARRRRDRGHQRPRPGRRAAGRGRRGQGARGRARQADLRRQPPRGARRRRPARARPAARAVPGDAGQRRALQPAAGRGRHRRRRAARRDHRRRRRGGLRQGRPAARPAVPRRPAHRPGGPRGRQRVHRLPARAHLAHATSSGTASTSRSPGSRPRSPAGSRPASAPASRCRWPTSRRQLPGGGLRRAGPQGARRRDLSQGIEDILIGGGVAANSRLRAMAEERAAAVGHPGAGAAARACAPTTARWWPPSAPRWSPAGARPPPSTCPPTPPCRSPRVAGLTPAARSPAEPSGCGHRRRTPRTTVRPRRLRFGPAPRGTVEGGRVRPRSIAAGGALQRPARRAVQVDRTDTPVLPTASRCLASSQVTRETTRGAGR